MKPPRAVQPVLESCVCIVHTRACTECQIVQDRGVLSIACGQCSNRPRCAQSLLENPSFLPCRVYLSGVATRSEQLPASSRTNCPEATHLGDSVPVNPTLNELQTLGGLVPPFPLLQCCVRVGARGQRKQQQSHHCIARRVFQHCLLRGYGGNLKLSIASGGSLQKTNFARTADIASRSNAGVRVFGCSANARVRQTLPCI